MPINSGELDWSRLLTIAAVAGGPATLCIEHCKCVASVRAAAAHLRNQWNCTKEPL